MFIQATARSREQAMSYAASQLHRVVVIGRGPAADKLVRALRGAPADVVVVDHGGAARVEAVDMRRRVVALAEPAPREITFDTLAVAAGTEIRFAGADWTSFAGAGDLALEARVRMAHEFGDSEPDPVERARLLTFAVAGGGAADVALAAAIAERARELIGEGARVVLAAPALLPGAPEYSRERQVRALRDWGVELRLGALEQDDEGLTVDGERNEAATVARAAGVTQAEAARWVGEAPPGFVHLMTTGRDATSTAEAILRHLKPAPARSSVPLALELALGDALAWLRSGWRAALS